MSVNGEPLLTPWNETLTVRQKNQQLRQELAKVYGGDFVDGNSTFWNKIPQPVWPTFQPLEKWYIMNERFIEAVKHGRITILDSKPIGSHANMIEMKGTNGMNVDFGPIDNVIAAYGYTKVLPRLQSMFSELVRDPEWLNGRKKLELYNGVIHPVLGKDVAMIGFGYPLRFPDVDNHDYRLRTIMEQADLLASYWLWSIRVGTTNSSTAVHLQKRSLLEERIERRLAQAGSGSTLTINDEVYWQAIKREGEEIKREVELNGR